MEEMETEGLTPEQIYRPGDVVWVKISGMWWPAEVKDQATLDPEITEGLKKQPLAVVQFLKEDTYEHIKSLDNIYHYVCKRKEEFLKLGFKKYYRLKNEKNMAMYPESIQEAERRTGGDPEIIHDPKILPQEAQETKMENGGRNSLPANFKTKKVSAPRRSAPAPSGDATVIRRDGDKEVVVGPVEIEKQGPSWYPYPHHIKYFKSERKAPEGDLPAPVWHRCSLCCFETLNVDILMAHHQYNQHNTTLGQPNKYRWKNPLNLSDKKTKPRGGIKKTVVKKKKDLTKSIEKRQRKKKKDLPPVPAGQFTPSKKSKLSSPSGTPSALEVSQECAKIIEEWTDDEDESKTNDATYGDDVDCSASTNDNTMEVTAEISEPFKDSEQQQNRSGATPSKIDKQSEPSKASCFDFDDDELAEPDLQSLKFGQKLPRVITPEKSKPPDPLRDGDDIDDLLKEVSVPEIPSLPPSKQESVYSRGDRTYGSSPLKEAKKSAATSPDKGKSDADVNADGENKKNEEKHFLVEGPLQSKKRKSSGRTEGAEDGSALNKKLKTGVSPKIPSSQEVMVTEVANKESSNIAETRAAELAKQSLIDTLTYSPKQEDKTVEDENSLLLEPEQIENCNGTLSQPARLQVEDIRQTEVAETVGDAAVAEKKSPAKEHSESPKSGRQSQVVNSASEELLEVETLPQAQRPQRKSSDKAKVEEGKHELTELSDAPLLDIASGEVPQDDSLVLNVQKDSNHDSPASCLANQTLNEESMKNQANESPFEVPSIVTADTITMKEETNEVSRQSKSQSISSRRSQRLENQLPPPAREDDMVCEGTSKTENAEPVAPPKSPTKSPTASSRQSKRSKNDDSQGTLELAKATTIAEPKKSETIKCIHTSSADDRLKSPSMPSRRSSRNKSAHSEEIVELDIEASPTSVQRKRNKTLPHESTEPSLLEEGTLKKQPELNERGSLSRRSVKAKPQKEAHVGDVIEPKEVAGQKNEDTAESKISSDLIKQHVDDVLLSPKVADAAKSLPIRKSERSKRGSASPGKVEQSKVIKGVVQDQITEYSKAPSDTPESLKSPSLPSRRSTRKKSAHSEDTAEPIKSPKADDVPEAHVIQSGTNSVRMSKRKKSIDQEPADVQSLPVVASSKREASPEGKERARSSKRSKKSKSSNEIPSVLEMEPQDPLPCMEASPQTQLESIKNNETASEETNLLDRPKDIADTEREGNPEIVLPVNSHKIDTLPAFACVPTEITSSENLPNSKSVEEPNSVELSSVDQAPKAEEDKDVYESPRRSRRNQSGVIEETKPVVGNAKVIPTEVPKQSLDTAITNEPLVTTCLESAVLDSSVSPSKKATSLKLLHEVEDSKEVKPPSKGELVPLDKVEDTHSSVEKPDASIHEQRESQSANETAKVVSMTDSPKSAKPLISEVDQSTTNANEPRHLTAESKLINVTPGDNTDSSSDLINSANTPSENELVRPEIASLQKPEASKDKVESDKLGEDSAKSELALTSNVVLDSDILGDKSITDIPSVAETPSPLVEENEASKRKRKDESRKSADLSDKKKKDSDSSSHASRETQGSRKREDKSKRSSHEERSRETRAASSKGESYDKVGSKERSRSEYKRSSKESDKKEPKLKENSSSKLRHSSRKEKEIERVEEKPDRSSHGRSSRRSVGSSRAETSGKLDTPLVVKASKELSKSETDRCRTSKRLSEANSLPTKTPEKKESVSSKKPSELPKRSSLGASSNASRSEESELSEKKIRSEKGEAVTSGVGNSEHPSELSIDATEETQQIQTEDLPGTVAPTDMGGNTCVSSAAVNESPREKTVIDSVKSEITIDTNLAPTPKKQLIHSPSKTFRHDEAASLLEELLGSPPRSSPASSPKKVKADSPMKPESPMRSEHSKDIFLLSPSKVLGIGSPAKVVESNSGSAELTPSKTPPGLTTTPVRASRWDNPNLSVKSQGVSPTKALRSPGSKLKVEILSGSRVKSSPPEKTAAPDAPHVPSLEPESSSHQSDDELSALQAEILSYSATDKAISAAASEEKKDLKLIKDLGSVSNSVPSQLSTSLASSPSKMSSAQSEPLISPAKSVGSLRAGPANSSSLSEAAELANILKGNEEPFTQESICSGAPASVPATNLSDSPATANVVDVPFQTNAHPESFGSELLDIISMPIIFANDEGESLLPTADVPVTVNETVSSKAPIVPVVSSITFPSTDAPAINAPSGKVLTTSVPAPEPVHSTSSDPIPEDLPEFNSGDIPGQELIETEIIMDHSEVELQTLETPVQTQELSDNQSQYPSWMRPDIHEYLSQTGVEKKVYRAKRVKQMVIGIYDENHPDYNYYMSLPPCTVGTSNFKERWAEPAPKTTVPAPKPPTVVSAKMSVSSSTNPAGINSIKLVSSNTQLSAPQQPLSVDRSKPIVTVTRSQMVGAEVVLASSPAKNSPVRIVSTQSLQVPLNIIRQATASPLRPASSKFKQDVLTSLEKLKAGQLDPQMKNKLVGLANDPEVLAKLKVKNVSNLGEVKVATKNVIVSSANIPIARSSPAKSLLIPTTSANQPKNILVAAAQGSSQLKNKVVLSGNPEIKFTVQPSFRKMTLANSPKIVVTTSAGDKQPIVMGRSVTRTQSAGPGPSAIKVTQVPQRPVLVQGVKKPAQKVATQTIRYRKLPTQVLPATTVQRPSKPDTYAYVTLANNAVVPTSVVPTSDKTVYVVSGANKPAPPVVPGSDILAEALGNIGILPSDSEPFNEEPSQDLISSPSVVIAGSISSDQLSNISFETAR